MSTETRPDLTVRQREVYEYIRDHAARHGFSASVREIQKSLKIRSPNGVMCHLKALEKKGYLLRHPGHNRSLVVVDSGPLPDGLWLMAWMNHYDLMAVPLGSPPPANATHAIYLDSDEREILRDIVAKGGRN